jgi:transcription elongation factor
MPRAPQTPSPAKQASTDHSEPRVAHARDRANGRRPEKDGGRSDVALGVRVRVIDGPFAGKLGVVQDLDDKGGARVMLGLLAVRFELKDLTVQTEGRARPVLGTSHRKPKPERS